MPQVKITINEKAFPSEYVYINDTLSIGRIIEPDGKGDFRQSAGKWNMTTGQISIMPYSGPKGVHKKRATLAASAGHDIYVECHRFYNLMTICNFNGELICNIFGPNWDGQYDGRIEQFGRVEICGDKIVALYSGERAVYENATTTNLPSRFLVFSISGDYLQTIETGYNISDFRYDPGKNRIIMNLDDEMQFAYLDLDGII
jgi:hypothetical protein